MKNSIIKILKNYFSTQPIQKAWLFGSVSRGEDGPESDVDILVEFDPNGQVSLFKHASMMTDLEDLLKRSVDLVSTGSHIFPWVKETIDNDKILIYERETTR